MGRADGSWIIIVNQIGERYRVGKAKRAREAQTKSQWTDKRSWPWSLMEMEKSLAITDGFAEHTIQPFVKSIPSPDPVTKSLLGHSRHDRSDPPSLPFQHRLLPLPFPGIKAESDGRGKGRQRPREGGEGTAPRGRSNSAPQVGQPGISGEGGPGRGGSGDGGRKRRRKGRRTQTRKGAGREGRGRIRDEW